VAAASSATAVRVAGENQQRRKSVSALLKDLEKQQKANKIRLSMRKRIEQAGLKMDPRTFYVASGFCGLIAAAACEFFHLSLIATVLGAFAAGVGLPRWLLLFLKARRQKAFTAEFANAIDVIVRSVKSGLPTNEALKIVAREMPQPVSGEFDQLVESLKVGVTLDQGVRRMYERMPTAEVNFFGIVMTIQSRTGGNLSEALSNLSAVLRDRKRLQGKIRAMSSEAKASAMIIGSLPPSVALMVYMSSPNYILPLFTTRAGNLMLAACVLWMSCGIFVMQRMISFKH
jgi:tight adherence protein B